MIKKDLLLILFCMCIYTLPAENAQIKEYPGSSVVAQQVENHRLMLKSLQDLATGSHGLNEKQSESIDELINLTKAALISFEYFDSVWAGKAGKLAESQKPVQLSANLLCACNAEGLCDACGGDGYVWIPDLESRAKKCRKCGGSGQTETTDCSGCRGSGWANAHSNSPANK